MPTKTIPTLLFAGLLLAAFPGRAAAEEKPRILVLDLSRVVSDSDEGRDFVGRLVKEKAAAEKKLAEAQTKLAETKRELQKAKLGERDQTFYERLEKAMAEDARVEMEKQLFVVQKSDEIARRQRQIILGALQEARRIMKERGAEMVLSSRTGALEMGTEQSFQEELVMRRVLCMAHKDADITDTVIKRMNEWYAQNKREDGTVVREQPAGDGSGEAGDGDASGGE